jgi:hypothetical protein
MLCNAQKKIDRCTYSSKHQCENCSGGSCGIAAHIKYHREGKCIMDVNISSSEDVSVANKVDTDIERMFRMRADKLLNGTILEVLEKKYRISEIEFYYYEKDIHEDEYAHRDDLQLENGKFYPHRINGKGFKAGTYKCMDITYGDRVRGIYFGVLIRSIRDLATGEFFTGPCVSVNEILRNFEATEWKELDGDVISFVNEHFLLKDMAFPPSSIFTGPRVGLSDKYPDFKDREYRYAIDVREIKKQKIFKQLV